MNHIEPPNPNNKSRNEIIRKVIFNGPFASFDFIIKYKIQSLTVTAIEVIIPKFFTVV